MVIRTIPQLWYGFGPTLCLQRRVCKVEELRLETFNAFNHAQFPRGKFRRRGSQWGKGVIRTVSR